MNAIAYIESTVQQKLKSDASGHDWWHILRVRRLALYLARQEHADTEICEIAALLHETCDHKLVADAEQALQEAEICLRDAGGTAAQIKAVLEIIPAISFKGAGVPDRLPSKEAQIVQDADRLDAMGAIGIARTFAYGGSRGRPLYDPDFPVEMHQSFQSYKKSTAPAINHFYEKLLLLKDRMHTVTAKQMAKERHQFMLDFLNRFFSEWNLRGDATISNKNR